MILLNFSHPITAAQQSDIQTLTRQKIDQVIEVPVQMGNVLPYAEQIRQLVNEIPLDAMQWQTDSILVNPPGFNFAAVALLAELHGRMGYFPSILRIRPEKDTTPQRYEVAEIINLQEIREVARSYR